MKNILESQDSNSQLQEELKLLLQKRQEITLELANIDTEIIGIKLILGKRKEEERIKKANQCR